MKTVTRLSAEDRSDLFRNTADRMQMSDAIVEKDFWVCFTLDYLFHRSPWKDSITFKGGTSLSKAYYLMPPDKLTCFDKKRDSPRLVMSPSIGSVCLGCTF